MLEIKVHEFQNCVTSGLCKLGDHNGDLAGLATSVALCRSGPLSWRSALSLFLQASTCRALTFEGRRSVI